MLALRGERLDGVALAEPRLPKVFRSRPFLLLPSLVALLTVVFLRLHGQVVIHVAVVVLIKRTVEGYNVIGPSVPPGGRCSSSASARVDAGAGGMHGGVAIGGGRVPRRLAPRPRCSRTLGRDSGRDAGARDSMSRRRVRGTHSGRKGREQGAAAARSLWALRGPSALSHRTADTAVGALRATAKARCARSKIWGEAARGALPIPCPLPSRTRIATVAMLPAVGRTAAAAHGTCAAPGAVAVSRGASVSSSSIRAPGELVEELEDLGAQRCDALSVIGPTATAPRHGRATARLALGGMMCPKQLLGSRHSQERSRVAARSPCAAVPRRLAPLPRG